MVLVKIYINELPHYLSHFFNLLPEYVNKYTWPGEGGGEQARRIHCETIVGRRLLNFPFSLSPDTEKLLLEFFAIK
jgi:hypothetical protein